MSLALVNMEDGAMGITNLLFACLIIGLSIAFLQL